MIGSGTYEAATTSTLGRGEESGEEGELTVEHTRRLGGGLGAAGAAPETKKIDGSRRWGRRGSDAAAPPSSSRGHQTKESTRAELTDKVSGRGAAGGRDNDEDGGDHTRAWMGNRGRGRRARGREREEGGKWRGQVGEGRRGEPEGSPLSSPGEAGEVVGVDLAPVATRSRGTRRGGSDR